MDSDYKLSVAYNPCICRNTVEPVDRQLFWENYKQQGINALLLLKQKRQNLLIRILKKYFDENRNTHISLGYQLRSCTSNFCSSRISSKPWA